MRGVVVTGVGIVTCLGRGESAHLTALREGRSGLKPLSLFSLQGLAPVPVGQVEAASLDAAELPRSALLALTAAKDALGGRTLTGPGVLAIGITTGGIHESEQHYLRHRGADSGAVDRAELTHHSAGTVADVLARRLGLGGERQTFSTACSSSANAIGYGALCVEQGAPWALVGGTDSLSRLTYGGFHSLRLLSPNACRPFDAQRRGLSLGEAAAFLLLEPEAAARARGAAIKGRIAGWGVASDAHHPTAPHPEGRGAAEAIRAALKDAELLPSEVSCINAHGTATPANDRAESMALAAVFGAEMPPVSSTKGMTGHTLGAAGAVEAVLSLLCLEHGFVPGTVGMETPDPELAVHHAPRGGLSAPLQAVLSNSFGFGGNNAALVFRKGA